MSLLVRLDRAVLGPRPDRMPPARVVAAIGRLQQSSEVLIGWVQLGLAATFATLYTLAPKAFMHDSAMLAPVPLALGIYAAFSLARLVLAYHDVLPRWILALSVMADMALLLGLIWSFHRQYGQPPAFYLKAPTLLYVFIFIALRSLRFEVGYVLLAGATAAVGWLAMLSYAVMHSPGVEITRSYVAYITTNAILRGAEFDKVISILLVTLILALAIARARRLMIKAIVDGAAADELSRFFDPAVARSIAETDAIMAPGQGRAVEATILHCDIRGFTRLAATLAPDALMALLADYQSRVIACIAAQGGSVDKFLGDGVLASFGAARASDRHAAEAVAAAQAIVGVCAAWAAERAAAGLEPIRIGVTVASGTVIFGAVGDASRLEITVIGEPVNLAAKLDKHCKVEGAALLLPLTTYALALNQGLAPPAEAETLPARRVDGLAGPLDLVRLA